MTGTPIQNHTNDLAGILRFLGVFPDAPFKMLRDLCASIASDPWTRQLLSSICLRRPKTTINLPRRGDMVRPVRRGPDELALYEQANNDIKRVLEHARLNTSGIAFPEVLVKMNMLRQICNLGTSYRPKCLPVTSGDSSTGSALSALLQSLIESDEAFCKSCSQPVEYSQPLAQPYSKPHMTLCGSIVCGECWVSTWSCGTVRCRCSESSCQFMVVDRPDEGNEQQVLDSAFRPSDKVRTLIEAISSIPVDDKILVFSFWSSTLTMVQSALSQAGHTSRLFTGSMNPDARSRTVDEFSTDSTIRVLLISMSCGSNGLNLTVANHAFIMEPQWNPMLEEQALSRVHRMGQSKPVHAVRLQVAGTIEDNIRKKQADKRQLIESAFGGRNWIAAAQALTD